MRRKASTGVIFITIFLDLLGFGMVLPLMPLYATDPRFGASPAEIGWLMAIYSLMQFLFAPLWGRLSDRIGRRPVLIIGLMGSSISYVIYGLAGALWVLFAARAAAGIMGANVAAAQAAMADLTGPEKRTRAMGMIGAAFSLGFVLGPAFGGWLGRFGLEAAPFAAAALTGLNGLAAILFLGESLPASPASAAGAPSARLHPLSPNLWRAAAAYPGALAVSLLFGGFIILFSAFETTLPIWGAAELDWTMETAGWFFSYMGVVMALVQGGIVRRVAPLFGERRTAWMGLALVGLGFMLLGRGGHPLAALTALAAGTGFVHPSLASLVSLNVPADRQGLMMGLFQSMGALGRVVGPVTGGMIYAAWGPGLFLGTAAGVVGVLLGLSAVQGIVNDAQTNRSAPSPDAPSLGADRDGPSP